MIEDALRRNRRDRIARHRTWNPNQNQWIADPSRPCLERPEIRRGIVANGFRLKGDLNPEIIRKVLLRLKVIDALNAIPEAEKSLTCRRSGWNHSLINIARCN